MAASTTRWFACLQLPGGFRLLVGRDLEERERLREIVLGRRALVDGDRGRAGGRRRLVRHAARAQARRRDDRDRTQRSWHGDLSGRLPIAGTNDELDRLAGNLNAMLERIEALMHGLKEVSDNIAHDLKTPLTRLRNRCEEALAHWPRTNRSTARRSKQRSRNRTR